MHRQTMIVIAAGLLSSVAAAQRVDLSVDCNGQRLNTAEKQTCSSSEVRSATTEVDALTAQLEHVLNGRNREALIDTEMPVLRQRNDCSNTTSEARTCVVNVLSHRLSALKAAKNLHSSILSEIAQYTLIDTVYLIKWGNELAGKRRHVWGCMMLDPGSSPELRTRGSIGESISAPIEQRVPVIFKAMNEVRATWFYDAKLPCSHWEGVVQRQGAQFVLAEVEP
jgi:hypothetical protein